MKPRPTANPNAEKSQQAASPSRVESFGQQEIPDGLCDTENGGKTC